jgi:hypothetical protein
MVESVDPSYAPGAANEASMEELESKPRIPRHWANMTDRTRQSLLDRRWYKGQQIHGKDLYSINHSRFIVYFAHDNVDLSHGFCVTLQLSPCGTRHPHVYADEARDDDPASRIAVLIKGKLKDGEDFEVYSKQPQNAWKAPMIWNAIYDWLGGMSWEEIAFANEPRRFLWVDHKADIPREISKFSGQPEFTDNSLSLEQAERWFKEKSESAKRKQAKQRKREWQEQHVGKG